MFLNRSLLFLSIIYTFCSGRVSGAAGVLKNSNLIVGSIGFKRLTELTELCEVNDDLLFRTNDVQLRMNLDIFECLSKIRFNGTLKTTTLTSLSVKQWILWELDRFNTKLKVNWIPGTLGTCGNSRDFFLGGPCNLGPGSVKRVYNNLPEHTEIKITGRVHFFDEWNGESVYLKVNDQILWNESHNWCPSVTDSVCKKFGVDVCGTEYPDRLSVKFEVSMAHQGSSLMIEFSSSLASDSKPCDVSWGLDDVGLHIR